MIKPTKKMLEAAKQYLYAYARFCAWDNSDDMHDTEKWKHAFDFLVGYKITVDEFIKNHLPDDIQKAKDEAMSEGDPNDTEYWEGVWDSYDEIYGVS